MYIGLFIAMTARFVAGLDSLAIGGRWRAG